MTRRLPVASAPGPLENYCQQFDPLFDQRTQRDGFRRYLEGLLLPAERNKTLTALADTEPVLGAQRPRAQSLQWFLSESSWDPVTVNEQRVALLRADPVTAPTERCVPGWSPGSCSGVIGPGGRSGPHHLNSKPSLRFTKAKGTKEHTMETPSGT